jgi:hypothetical protein
MATTQSTPPARHVMPGLRAKERLAACCGGLAACCGGLAACCGCTALPTDQLPPKPLTGRPPPAPATDQLPPKPPTGRRLLGPTTGRPPPAPATDQLPPKPPTGRRPLGPTTGRPPPAPATDQPPPVRGTPISAGACGIILPEYMTERLAAARTEARKTRRMQMAKRARGKLQTSLPTSREAGALSEIEIIAILARATPVIGLPGCRRSAASSSQIQSASLESQGPPRQ